MRRIKKQVSRNRSGWTLIEMSIVISLLSMMSLVATSLVTILMELDTSIATASAFELTAQRFEDQLRSDAASAKGIQQLENGFDLVSDREPVIAYRIDKDTVTRTINGDRHRSFDSVTFVDTEVQMQMDSEGNEPKQNEPIIIHIGLTKKMPLESRTRTALLETRDGTSIHIRVPVGRSIRFQSTSPGSGDET